MKVFSINPYTEKKEFQHQLLSSKEINQKIQKSKLMQLQWAQTDFHVRLLHLKKFSEILRSRQSEIALIITKEMGKTLASAKAEVEKSAFTVDFLSERLSSWNQADTIEMPEGKHKVVFTPLGVTLGIMPWNFPIWQAVRFLAPSLALGNSVMLKPASNVFQSSKILEECLLQAGLPEGVYQHLSVDSKNIEQVVASPYVQGVSLTGSAGAGKKVAEVAGAGMKKMVFELGGSDPYIIMEDADLELAAQKCAESRLLNSGQSCICAKRFLVDKKVRDEFLDLFINEMVSKVYGDPNFATTDFGPLARKDLRLELHGQVQLALKEGGQLLIGGEIPKGKGYFYPPTIIWDIPKESKSLNTEFFGPVALVNEFETIDEAFEMANQTPFGLGSGIFSRNTARAVDLAESKMQAGMVTINDYVKSDVRLPFGGIKDSGFGRELGPYGVHEFANIKTISVF